MIVGAVVKARCRQLSGSYIKLQKITFNNLTYEKGYKILMLKIYLMSLLFDG